MVIDDSATVRKIVATSLGREGFEVKSFTDGFEAFKWLVDTSRIPDLELIDIALPKIDGYEVIRQIRQKPQFAAMVIILISRRDRMRTRTTDRLLTRAQNGYGYLRLPGRLRGSHLLRRNAATGRGYLEETLAGNDMATVEAVYSHQS